MRVIRACTGYSLARLLTQRIWGLQLTGFLLYTHLFQFWNARSNMVWLTILIVQVWVIVYCRLLLGSIANWFFFPLASTLRVRLQLLSLFVLLESFIVLILVSIAICVNLMIGSSGGFGVVGVAFPRQCPGIWLSFFTIFRILDALLRVSNTQREFKIAFFFILYRFYPQN